MAVAFKRGATMGPNDLNVTVRDNIGALIDPYRIDYAVYDNTTGVEVLLGSPANTPVRISTGQYYAHYVLPADTNIGDYLIRWTLQETTTDPVYQSVQEFNVVGDSTVLSFTGDVNIDRIILSLRRLLRDNDPDKNYRFRPPASEKFIQGQTQVFGFVWEDEELYEYLDMAVNDFNTKPPVTGITFGDLSGSGVRWKTPILLRASAFACLAATANWIVDEFSVGGEEKIVVKTEKGEEIALTIEELFNIINSFLLWPKKRKIKRCFKKGCLSVKSLNRETNVVEWAPIKDVLRHEAQNKRILKILFGKTPTVVTEDHSLFSWETKKEILSSELKIGSKVIAEKNSNLVPEEVTEINEIEKRKFMYDLSIPKNENFFLFSGILAHNSYTISGVSLDLEKSSKYQALSDTFTTEWDKSVEAAKRSIKIVKGLRQARFGVGITSALGPLSREGVQSRRNWVSAGRPNWL